MSDERPDGRALRYQHRKGEILEKVLQYLLDEGLDGLSFRKMATAVGISHVTLRHHFGTKDEMLLEVFDLIRAREPVPDELPQDMSIEDVVHGLWSWWTEPSNLRYLSLMFSAYGLALQKPQTYDGFLQSTIPHWIEDTRRIGLAAGCPPDQVDAYATLLVAQLRGLLLDLLSTGDEPRINDALALLTENLRITRLTWQA
ncbi:TetR/AcrR family transcriptional regulator [Aeromicrobium sp. Leaf350]|uniref:TetR/AcrR family transcriptional regulator n=1 Tax=Aeromicrobium sp. Leaf350 TaxID=2876565 RepID=UPI001E545592|nr:TetR/AcrR family transcriptional regulator [Aeromicrobium sp. Leaf350]